MGYGWIGGGWMGCWVMDYGWMGDGWIGGELFLLLKSVGVHYLSTIVFCLP